VPELPEVESVRRGLIAAQLRTPVRSVWRSLSRLRIGKHWAEENLGCLQGAMPGEVRRRGKYILWSFTGEDGGALGLVIHLGNERTVRRGVGGARPGVAHAPGPGLRGRSRAEVGRSSAVRRAASWAAGSADCDGIADRRARAGAARARVLGGGARAGARGIFAPDPRRAARPVGGRRAREYLRGRGAVPRGDPPAARGAVACIAARGTGWPRRSSPCCVRGSRTAARRLKDFRNVVGEVGRNQDDLKVYGRVGEPCPRCGAPLRGFVSGGRSGAYCPKDQPRPRGRLLR
jgi:formamidopyrimidine-DNA glycosylase